MKNLVHKRYFAAILFAMSMVSSTGAKAGPHAFAACKLSCNAACLFHIPWHLHHCFAACLVTCSKVALACFAEGTKIVVLENGIEAEKDIQSISVGELVRTLKNGSPIWTKVLRNIKTEGSFDFVQLEAKNLTSGEYQQLRVTPAHGMILVGKDGQLTLDAAEHLTIGDRIVASNGNILSVTEANKVVMQDKYTLETADGTVLASGLLVSTLCGEELEGGERLFESTMKDWYRRHNFSDNE